MSVRYVDAGVDLRTAGEITAQITRRLGAGLFGGFVPVSALKQYEAPVLVSSIDGVGTKVHLAARLGRVDGLGQDLVHHCVNDIAVHGATPLLFMDYLAFNRLDTRLVDRIVTSISTACEALGIELSGGETAEMPLVYPDGHFDMAGAIVGVVEESDIVDGSDIADGDVLVGLASSGLHTNGYSLVQHLFHDGDYGRDEPSLGGTLGDSLLEPHRCYLPEIRSLLASGAVHGFAHITGGGIAGNLSRIIPQGLQAEVDVPSPPSLFAYLASRGIAPEEMRAVFNMGIGLIAVCDQRILKTPQWGQGTVIGSRFQMLGTVRRCSNTERKVIFRDGH